MSDKTWSAQTDLPSTEIAPRVARRVLVELVKGWGQPHLDALVEDARIVVTELVTNAVVHAGGDDAVDLRIRAEQDGSLYLAVSDGAAVAPMMGELTDDAEGGRGLQIVQQLCTQWGVEADDSGGKRVWVELT